MDELQKLKVDMRNWAKGVKVTISTKEKAIKASFSQSYSRGKLKPNTRDRGPDFTLISQAKEREEESLLTMYPFTYNTLHGTHPAEEVLEVPLHYWVHYARSKEMERVKFIADTLVESEDGITSDAEMILAARKFGFAVEKRKEIQNMNRSRYAFIMSVDDYMKYEKQTKRIEAVFAKMTKADATFFVEKLAYGESSKLVDICKERLPIFAKKIYFDGFSGFVCFEEMGGEYSLRLYPGDASDHVEFSFETKVRGEDFKGGIVRAMERIQENQKMKNLLKAPSEVLGRYMDKHFPYVGQKHATVMMEKLTDNDVGYMEVEKEASEALAGKREIEKGIMRVGNFTFSYFVFCGQYVVLERKSDDVLYLDILAFRSKTMMANYMKDKVDAGLLDGVEYKR